MDCAGICLGDSLVDNCGDCSSPDDFNSGQDGCGVCYGENTDMDCAGVCLGDSLVDDCGDCSSPDDFNSSQDGCGVCNGTNECLLQIISVSNEPSSILPLYQEMISIQFSNNLAEGSESGIQITSTQGANIHAQLREDHSIIDIFLIGQLISGDNLQITVHADEIKLSENQDVNMGQYFPDSSWAYQVAYLGDYNNNADIDSEDIDILIQYWGSDVIEDYRYELGPCQDGSCLGANVPNLTPAFQYDGDDSYIDKMWNIEDLAAFMLMWKGDLSRTLVEYTIEDIGVPVNFEFEGELLFMEMPDNMDLINHIWFQIKFETNNASFNPENFDSKYDMVLSRSSDDERIKEWNFVNLIGIEFVDRLLLGSINSQSNIDETIEIHYKLTSREGYLNSGSEMLELTSHPNDFKLIGAYPNPFNPSTSVQYFLPIEAEINLSVYDIQGGLIEILSMGMVSSGYHETVWDGFHYSSGIYFVRFQVYEFEGTPGYSSLQKISLIK